MLKGVQEVPFLARLRELCAAWGQYPLRRLERAKEREAVRHPLELLIDRLRRLATQSQRKSRKADHAPRNPGVVVLITDRPSRAAANARRLDVVPPLVAVEVLPFTSSIDDRAGWRELHAGLRRIPAIDILIVAVSDDDVGERLLRQCLFYLPDDGIWVSVGDRKRTAQVRRLARRLRNVQRSRGLSADAESSVLKVGPVGIRQPEGEVATQRLASAIRSIRAKRSHLLIRTRGSRLIKVRESDMDQQLIDSRGIDWATERVHAEGFEFPYGANLHLNRERFRYRFEARFTAPPLKVREYTDVVCQRRQIVFRGGLVLPDTFRLTGQDYLRTSALQDVDQHFARPARQPEPKVLRGSYYYLDTEFPNVYGHLVTEMVGRLWAWHDVKARHPEVRLLISDRFATKDLPGWCRTTLHAFGVADDDIVLLHAPMRVEQLFAVTPQFVNYERGYAHPGIADVWSTIASELRARSSLTDPPERMFVSRPAEGDRLCRNRGEVERWFEDRGFAVVRPEQFSIPDQAVLFDAARVVAGYGGSAMLNAIYATGPARRLVINPWSYHALNEYLISGVYGDEITYLYQRPEVEKATPDFPRGPFHSPYTVDLEADREFLSAFAEA